MRLHVFNPEHDMALACGRSFFTAPHAARMLRKDLGFIPSLWAEGGDMVLVDDVRAALEAVRHVRAYTSDVVFVTTSDLRNMRIAGEAGLVVEPWGWDAAIRRELFACNSALAPMLPSNDRLANIRRLSNRRFASECLLPRLRELGGALVGKSDYLSADDAVLATVQEMGTCVLKEPWSCSGRGVRYVDSGLSAQAMGWVRNVISRQGGIMAEPFYNKVMDFGMEFVACVGGRVRYCGLSLFSTRNGAYAGSVLATEKEKRRIMSKYVSLDLLDAVKDGICDIMAQHLANVYKGPFGIDMMIVTSGGKDGFKLHPCVELNMRRTMGHVALAVSPNDSEPQGLMRIAFEGACKLRISHTSENLLNTSMFC